MTIAMTSPSGTSRPKVRESRCFLSTLPVLLRSALITARAELRLIARRALDRKVGSVFLCVAPSGGCVQTTPRGHVLLRLSLGIGVRLPFAIGDQRAVLLWSNRRGRTSDGGGQTTLPPFTTTDFCARTAVPLLQVQGPSSGFTGVGDFARAAELNHEVRDHAAPQNTNISVPVDIGIRRNGGSRIDQEPGDDDAPGQINGICRYRTRAHEAIATRHATCTSTEPHNAQPLVL